MGALAPFPKGFTRPARDPDCRQASVGIGDEILVYKPIPLADGTPPRDGLVYAVGADDPAGLQGKRVVFKGPVGQAWETWMQLAEVPA
jgi:hypothetical protein